MRSFPALLVAALLLAATCAGTARAEAAPRAVIVLDRGADAQSGSVSDAANALRIWKTLEARGVDARLFAAGIGTNGKTRVARVTPTRAGVASLAKDAMFGFRGATDARATLATVLEQGGEEAVDLILLGPWSAVPAEKAKAYAATVERWNAKAPKGSRILSIGRGPGRDALGSARGWAGDGRVVLGFDAPHIETEPYSPLPQADGPPAALVAQLRVLGDVLWMGEPQETPEGRTPGVLTLSSDVTHDRVEARVNAGLHTWRVLRRVQDARAATVTFERVEEQGVYWLGDVPAALSFRWDKLTAAARLADAEGGAATRFVVEDAEAEKPVSTTLRLQRTLSGRTPAWKVGVEEGALPPGLAVDIGAETRTSPEVGESEVRITFTARVAAPLETQGVITLAADGMPTVLRLPYSIRVPGGKATWVCEPAPAALPHAAADAPTKILLRAENANVPPTLPLVASCDGGQEGWLSAHVRTPSGAVSTWRLGKTIFLPVGTRHELTFFLEDGAPSDLDWPCVVTLSVKEVPGVRFDGEPAGVSVRRRKPRLVLQRPLPEHRVLGPTLIADEPPVLTLDADGGDGAWLMALREVTPVVRVGGDAPVGWQAVPRGPGIWHLVPAGRWDGAEQGIFEDKTFELDLGFAWEPGDVPEPARVPVRIPARWGKKGFLFLGLAGLAMVLALTVMGWMRTPPVKGTLLYTVDGLAGTVGRLDLTPVKRRTQAITSDTKGRLHVAGAGDLVAKVRPTRVGGMLEYVDAEGTRERRLLVDGLSLRLGRHLLRYVSGRAQDLAGAAAPTEVPDLLGPEYDLESGRIDALDDEPSD